LSTGNSREIHNRWQPSNTFIIITSTFFLPKLLEPCDMMKEECGARAVLFKVFDYNNEGVKLIHG
jgi:hypothetical protein